jgi:hypothetical protein
VDIAPAAGHPSGAARGDRLTLLSGIAARAEPIRSRRSRAFSEILPARSGSQGPPSPRQRFSGSSKKRARALERDHSAKSLAAFSRQQGSTPSLVARRRRSWPRLSSCAACRVCRTRGIQLDSWFFRAVAARGWPCSPSSSSVLLNFLVHAGAVARREPQPVGSAAATHDSPPLDTEARASTSKIEDERPALPAETRGDTRPAVLFTTKPIGRGHRLGPV